MKFSLFGFEFNDLLLHDISGFDPEFGIWFVSFKGDNDPRALLGIHYDVERGWIGQFLFMNFGA